jgi:hypothetical protein
MRVSFGAWHEKLAYAFGCDLRSLAAFRIAIGLLLLAGLAWRLPEFHEHYTDVGAWPIAAAHEDAPLRWPLSLYFLSGEPWWTAALFVVSALAAVALAAGWRTRTASVVSWVLLVSLQNRNGLMLNGGDVILRLLLFWGIFLPLGACWSVDARGRPKRRAVLVSTATVALLLQVAMVYFFNALYKTGASWRLAGTAIEESLRMETYATQMGHALLAAPGFLRFSTYTIWWLELLGPFLPFLPWRNALFRFAAVVLFMSFHAALFLCLRIGLFPLVGLSAWLPFLPAQFWNRFRVSPPEVPPLESRPWRWQVAPAIFLAFIFVWNISGFEKASRPEWFRRAGLQSGLDQKWQLFAPIPLQAEGWHVAVLECSDGLEYDALTGQEVNWDRPKSLAAGIRSVNWRKFLHEIRMGPSYRGRYLCEWIVREWNATHPSAQVQRIRLHYLWEWTANRQNPPDNQLVYEDPPGELTKELLARTLKEKRQPGKPVEPAEVGDL